MSSSRNRRWIPIIVNPAVAGSTPLLGQLNRVFNPEGVYWTVEVTHAEGEAAEIARRLAAAGAEVVAVYGGDGTIGEAAWGISGSATALAILPGGTGNVLAFEFGTPRTLAQAARLILDEHDIRLVDLGEVSSSSGQRQYLLRAGAGLEALAMLRAPRELKERLGLVAYGLAGVQALIEAKPVRYRLELDGRAEEAQGVLCSIANSAHLGLSPTLNLFPVVDIQDGLLNVMVMTRVDLENIIALLSKRIEDHGALGRMRHWQVRQALITADPPQSVQVDGDPFGSTPLRVRSIPQALRVIVPRKNEK
ncbi:MAG: diacylglycerol/lipid kinase family protein [Chloroflexota bacterium]